MAKLTSKERKALPKGDFAIPGKRAYPVNDQNHARNALARVSQHGTPAQKAEVRAKVASKYPGIDQAKRDPKGARGVEQGKKSGDGGQKAPAKPPSRGNRPPDPDTRHQSSQFRAPPSMKGGPKPPHSIPSDKGRADRGHSSAQSNATAGRGSKSKGYR